MSPTLKSSKNRGLERFNDTQFLAGEGVAALKLLLQSGFAREPSSNETDKSRALREREDEKRVSEALSILTGVSKTAFYEHRLAHQLWADMAIPFEAGEEQFIGPGSETARARRLLSEAERKKIDSYARESDGENLRVKQLRRELKKRTIRFGRLAAIDDHLFDAVLTILRALTGPPKIIGTGKKPRKAIRKGQNR